MRKTILAFLMVAGLMAVDGYAIPDHSWKYTASTHFVICYNEATAAFVKETAAIAEAFLRKSAAFYYTGLADSLAAKKIVIVLSDDSDDPNGSAWPDFRLVEIYCRKGPISWRGNTDWLRTALSHELGHAFTFLNGKFKLRLGLDFRSFLGDVDLSSDAGWFIHEGEPPAWYIEGLAQFGSQLFGADARDPYREMLLRDAFLYGRLLGLEELSRFEGTGRDAELLYNQGYDLVMFMSAARIPMQKTTSSAYLSGFLPAVKSTAGRDMSALYGEWKKSLAARFAGFSQEGPASLLFPERGGDYTEEVSVRENGSFVVANWDHDYSIRELFVRKDGVLETIRDVGPRLARDRKTGEVYYSSLRYSGSRGVAVHDIRRYDPAGADPFVTRDSRSLVFDALDGVLYYAAYDAGVTTLYRKVKDKAPEKLKTFDRSTSVDSIAVLDKERIVLALGAGPEMKAALLEQGELTFLWPGLAAEVRDVFAYDDRTLFFTSTLGGSPQVFRASLNEPGTWYQLTSLNGGAFAPVVEDVAGKPELFYSGYRDGSFRIARGGDPFRTDLPADPAGPPGPTNASAGRPLPGIAVQDSSAFLFLAPLRLDLAYGYRDFVDSRTNRILDRRWSVGSSFGMIAPTRTFDAWGGLRFGIPVHKNDPFNRADPDYNAGFSAEILNCDLGFSFTGWQSHYDFDYTNSSFGFRYRGYDVWSSAVFGIDARIETGLHSGLDLFWEYQNDNFKEFREFLTSGWVWSENMEPSIEDRIAGISTRNEFGFGWWSYRPLQVRQVYAGLRQGADQYWVRARSVSLGYNDEYWSTNYLVSRRTFFPLEAGASLRRLLLWNALSLEVAVDGFAWIGPRSGARYAPNSFGSLGGEGFFSGYPGGFFPARAVSRLLMDVRFAPFVGRSRPVRWYQRFSVGAKIEAGVAVDMLKGSGQVFPASVELSLRHEFYLNLQDPNLLYVKFAVPLTDLGADFRTDPWQIYVGLSVNYFGENGSRRERNPGARSGRRDPTIRS